MSSAKEHPELKLIFWALLVGLSLIPLLPIGITVGIDNFIFHSLFALHLGIFAIALGYGCVLLFPTVLQAWESSRWDFKVLLVFAPIILVCVTTLLSSTPITARDALIHHLAVPAWWIQSDRIFEIPWHEWSYYPMLINLGYTALLSVGLESLTPWYHYAFLLLLCLNASVFCVSRKLSAQASLAVGLLIASIPVCIRLGTTPLVDLGLALYSSLALFSVVYWFSNPKSNRAVLYFGIALGLALSCKLNALLVAALIFPTLFIAANVDDIPRWFRIRAIVIAGLLAVVVYSPWLIKNFLWTGNPVFPLFKSLFADEIQNVGLPAGLNPIQQRLQLYGESWWQLLLLPIRILLFGEDDNPRLFDGRLSPILLLALLALPKGRKDSWVTLSITFSLSYLLFALVMSGARVRYLAPIYAPMAILSVYGLTKVVSAKRLRPAATLAVLLQFFVCISYCITCLTQDATLSYLFGKGSKSKYMRAHIPEYPMAEFMNAQLGQNSLTYLLGTGNRFYIYHTPVRSGGHYSAGTIVSAIRQSQDPAHLADNLKQRGFTHLMAHINRSQAMLDTALSEQQKEIWHIFQHEFLDGIIAENGFALWKIK